jgi:predicted MFS family arabinose efflux permease
MNRALTFVAFVVFSGALFVRSIDPIVPQIAFALHVDPNTAALLTTAYALPYALIQPLLGALADMFSKTRLMIICLAVISAATLAGAVIPDFRLLMVTRVLAGLGSGGLVPVAFAIVGDLVPVERRQVAMGRILFAIMSGNLLGALGAGAIADLAGWRAVFVAMALLGFSVFAVVVPGLRGIATSGGGFNLSTTVANYRAIFGNPLAKVCYSAVFVEAVFMYGLFPHLATLLRQIGETRATIAGLVIAAFGIGGIIYSLRVAWLLARLGEQTMMRIGGCVMGFCIGFVALRLPWPYDFADFVLLGLGFYMLHGVIQIYTSELAPSARGSSLALHGFFYFLGQAAGPAVYNVGFSTVGMTAIISIGAVALVLNGLVCAQYLRRPSAI